MKGTLRAQGGGTLVEVTLRVHDLVLVITLIHGLFLLGIAWIMGICAFSREVDNATTGLATVCGVTIQGDEALQAGVSIADPTAPGAEANPPYSLRTHADGESVRFEVRGPRTSHVEVDLAWITVGRDPEGPVRVSWDELQACSVDVTDGQPRLTLRASGATLALPGTDHPPGHLEWLALYLESRALRWRGSDAEHLQADAARRALGALRNGLTKE